MTKDGEIIKKKIRGLRASLNRAEISRDEAWEINSMLNDLIDDIPSGRDGI